ncbi:MAG TPA: orotidine-5'-phosphate decarboxylase [Gemmatimonadaceae bacterium]|nr:orotidine-5'-phosphate decarboxylase [Gemmatimonadaceae bacterium]
MPLPVTALVGVTPIVALDVPTRVQADALADRLRGLCGFYKVGSELFTAEGPPVVRGFRERGAEVFLDLKFHDIPNTVREGARSATRMGARLLTVHAAGGRAMVEAAVEGAGDGCGILAVTVLTSMDERALAEASGRDGARVEDEVLRLAGVAAAAGAYGVVCSGREAPAVRARFGDALRILVPGVRFADGASHDQARVVTPAGAAEAGASYVVLGRVVTAHADPAAAMRRACAELAGPV